MNIPTFINEAGFETAIKPWHRPDVVEWPAVAIPELVSYTPTNYPTECCCEPFTGFSGAYYAGPVTAVPELPAMGMFVAGVLLMYIKWRRK